MTLKTITLHMYAKTGQWDKPGDTQIFDCDMRNSPVCMKDLVWLGQVDVELDFPEIDITSAQIESLEAEIQKERADSQVRVNLLLERISKLKAIGHEVDHE